MSKYMLLFYFAFGLSAQHLSIPTNAQIERARLQDLEQELQRIEQKLLTELANLEAIKSQIQTRALSASSLTIKVLNQVSDRYDLLETVVKLDGQIVNLPYHDDISTGAHEISVEQLYRGSASVGAGFENNTFRLSGHTSVDVSKGIPVSLDVVTIEKADNLSIHFSQLVAEKKVESPVVVIVQDPAGSAFQLEGQAIWIDGKSVESLTPALVTPKGLVVFSGNLEPGDYKFDVVLRYHVDGNMIADVKTEEVRLRFSKNIDVKVGQKTQISLQGYTKSTGIVPPPAEETEGEIQVLDEVMDVGAP